MNTSTRIIVRHEREELARNWRRRATALERQADTATQEGDQQFAAELQAAATDYRVAADELEYGIEP